MVLINPIVVQCVTEGNYQHVVEFSNSISMLNTVCEDLIEIYVIAIKKTKIHHPKNAPPPPPSPFSLSLKTDWYRDRSHTHRH